MMTMMTTIDPPPPQDFRPQIRRQGRPTAVVDPVRPILPFPPHNGGGEGPARLYAHGRRRSSLVLPMEKEFGIVSWPHFSDFVNMRFGPPIRSNSLGELKELRRTGTVEEYQRQFLALLCRCDNLRPRHQIDLFTAGLGQPLGSDVEMQRPSNLQTAMSLARAYERRHQEAALAAAASTGRAPTRARPAAAGLTPAAAPLAKPDGAQKSLFRRPSPEELAEKRRKGECYFCTEQFGPDHKCATKGVFLLELDDGATEEEAANDLGISLHALTGISTAKTMQLRVRLGDTDLLALVDSGSTHTFLDDATARRLGLHITPRPGLSPGICSDAQMTIQGEVFDTTCYVLALDGFDLVLGVQWLATLGPIVWDFAALSMEFWRDGHVVRWHGVDTCSPALRAVGQPQCLLETLLAGFEDVFAVPTTLPPVCPHDHCIHLLPGTAPIAVGPYRYPQLLKDEIERQCSDMLAQGIIRTTTSPFSSPVLLVKKHDGSWRFCVDYRTLNDKKVKDKFPIPVVDELIDELKGARYFTKLDLRSGYHQVRMHPDDIAKTAFRTHHGHFEFLVMPFGLTNAPATFQALMNDILHAYIRRFVLVFFDDILIYSSSWAEHLQHVKAILQLLRSHGLFLKRSKCFFGESFVAYLGHIISAARVAKDPSKVAAVEAWPRPRTARALRGFLRLTNYYRKFITGYGGVARPLTALLKGEAFSWTPEADQAFLDLKRALVSAPLLQLPDFSARFFVDCDASGSGFGAVLHQGDGAIAFFSRPVAPQHAKLPAYERELIGLVKAVRYWRPYLWGRPFTVRTDHWSLKFILDQRLTTIPQHTWVSKLFGYDITVEHRPGKQNIVADALSRRDEEPSLAITCSGWSTLRSLREELAFSPQALAVRAQIAAGTAPPGWTDVDGLLLFKGHAFVPDDSVLWPQLLAAAHEMGHEGAEKTLHRFRASFYSRRAHRLVREFVRGCVVCQQNKTEHLHPAGLLQPLPVPSEVWTDISMDFVEGFPKVGGKSVVLTVVDRFSKYGHFIPLGHPYSASSVARAFFDGSMAFPAPLSPTVIRCSPVIFGPSCFVSRVSSYFSVRHFTRKRMANPKSPTELLLCICGALQVTDLALGYSGFHGPNFATILLISRRCKLLRFVWFMVRILPAWCSEIRERLLLAQDTMKLHSNKQRRDLSFAIGDWVWLRLHHRHASAIITAGASKLGPRFYGPYQITERIGEVAYRLKLPDKAKIHDVFHVALLKQFTGTPPSSVVPLPPVHHGRVLPQPQKVLRARLNRSVWEVLVQWLGRPASEATWEQLESFTTTYPEMQLADELFVGEGGSVVDAFVGRAYRRRKSKSG
ncbi:hypothetical protein U9M48_017555 [Paspalum notatum var. saurae]|uniref:Reverse transcriptase n=1 Tax=Paspalum notatum var. saurae TaxID=547442 RepID=A0AAQ3WNY8_PASNO